MRLSRTLSALGAFFVLAVAIAGCGSAIPGDSVASVAGNPITTQAFNHWMYVAAKGNASQDPTAPVIVPNDPPGFQSCIKQARAQIPSLAKTPAKTLKTDCATLFTSLSSQVMDFLIKAYWYQLEAHRLNLNLTTAQVNKAFEQAKAQSGITSTATLNNFLKESGQTAKDLLYRVRVNEIYKDLIARQTKKITAATIAAYYNAHPSQFGTPESRNLRIIRTNSQSSATAAKAALASGQSWQTVAKKYSVDSATKNTGGLLTGVTNGEEEHALNTVAFAAPLNKLEGPVHGTFGWYVVEVIKINKATTHSLAKETPLIKQLLVSKNGTAAQTAVDNYAKKYWGKQTLCRSAYAMADCHGYKAPKTATTGSATAPATGTSTTG